MGFFSAIGSFISGVASGIGKIASGIASAVTGAVSTLGNLASKAISSFVGGIASKAGTLLKAVSSIWAGPLGTVLGPIIVDLAVKVIVKVVTELAKKYGVVEKNDKPEEIGYRLEEADKHADWRGREDFTSFKGYYSYLKEQIPEEEIDTVRLKKNFGTYSLLGAQAEVQALEEKFDLRIPKASLIEIGRSAMEVKEVQAFIRAFEELGYKYLNISEYLKGTLPAGELERITAALLDAMKFYFPEKTEGELVTRLNDMRKAANDDKFLVSVYKEDLKQEYGKEIQEAQKNNEIPEQAKKILEDAGFDAAEIQQPQQSNEPSAKIDSTQTEKISVDAEVKVAEKSTVEAVS